MKTTTQKWIHGLGAAFIGGGAGAVTSGLTSMGFAPDKFNLTNGSGVAHLFGLMAANFIINGSLSAMFFLRQAPLPDVDTSTVSVSQITHDSAGNVTAVDSTTTITKPKDPQV